MTDFSSGMTDFVNGITDFVSAMTELSESVGDCENQSRTVKISHKGLSKSVENCQNQCKNCSIFFESPIEASVEMDPVFTLLCYGTLYTQLTLQLKSWNYVQCFMRITLHWVNPTL